MDRRVDVLLIGGGVASVRCARALRRAGYAGSILIVGDEPHPPYNRPPLSKELLRDDLPDDLVHAEPPTWYDRRGVELATGRRVVELDLEPRTATLDDGGRIGFERCLVATGAEPLLLPVPGIEHALLLRTLTDARRLRAAALAAGPGARVALVGGGLIGVELASSLAELGLRPVILERAAELWGGILGSEFSAWAMERLGRAGVDVRLGVEVTRIDTGGAWAGDELVEAAFTLTAVGVRPRTDLAAAAGLQVDGGIVTDGAQRASHPAVWAAGDAARTAGRRVEHWHAAREAGERAARSMLGRDPAALPVPWFFSEVAGAPIDVLGDAVADDETVWIVDGSVLAWVREGRVIQLAVVDGALDPTAARGLIAAGARPDEVATAMVAATPTPGS